MLPLAVSLSIKPYCRSVLDCHPPAGGRCRLSTDSDGAPPPLLRGARGAPSRSHHDRPWTLGRSPRCPVRQPALTGERTGHPKPVVVVAVSGVVPVAVGRAKVPRIVVPGAAAHHPTVGGRSGPSPIWIIPSAAKDGLPRPPAIGMCGVRDPRLHASIHLGTRDRAGAPAIAQPAQTVAEPPHVVLGQASAAARQKYNPKNRAVSAVGATPVLSGCRLRRRPSR